MSNITDEYYTPEELREIHKVISPYILTPFNELEYYKTLADFKRHPLSYEALTMPIKKLPKHISSIPPLKTVVLWRLKRGK